MRGQQRKYVNLTESARARKLKVSDLTDVDILRVIEALTGEEVWSSG